MQAQGCNNQIKIGMQVALCTSWHTRPTCYAIRYVTSSQSSSILKLVVHHYLTIDNLTELAFGITPGLVERLCSLTTIHSSTRIMMQCCNVITHICNYL